MEKKFKKWVMIFISLINGKKKRFIVISLVIIILGSLSLFTISMMPNILTPYDRIHDIYMEITIKEINESLGKYYNDNKKFPKIDIPKIWGGDCLNYENSLIMKKLSPYYLSDINKMSLNIKQVENVLCSIKPIYQFWSSKGKSGFWYKSFDYKGGKNNAYVICTNTATNFKSNINLDIVKEGNYEDIKNTVNEYYEKQEFENVERSKWGYCVFKDVGN